MDRPLEEIGRRNEVGVEDRDELAGRRLQTFLQRAGLVSVPVRAVAILDRMTHRLIACAQRLGERMRLVGGIVQHLDLEQLPRITHLQRLFDKALHDEFLVVKRQLDRDSRQLLEARRPARPVSFFLCFR